MNNYKQMISEEKLRLVESITQSVKDLECCIAAQGSAPFDEFMTSEGRLFWMYKGDSSVRLVVETPVETKPFRGSKVDVRINIFNECKELRDLIDNLEN